MMLLTTILSLRWRSFFRSPAWEKSLGMKLFGGFMVLYFGAAFGALGWAIPYILKETYPQMPLAQSLGQFVCYYLLLDLLMRYYSDKITGLDLQPLLLLLISKRSLAHISLGSQLSDITNLSFLLLAGPSIWMHFLPEYGVIAALGYTFSLLCCTLLSSLLMNALRSLQHSTRWLLLLLAAIVSVGYLDYIGMLPLRAFSATIWASLLLHPWLNLLPIGLLAAAYLLSVAQFTHNLNLEYLKPAQEEYQDVQGFSFLQRYGQVGELLLLELKLIMRHKRTRNAALVGAMLSLYGLIFLSQKGEGSMGWQFGALFGIMFATGGIAISYGQYLFAWESAHFDGLMSQPISLRKYMDAKYALLCLLSTISFVPCAIIYTWYGGPSLLLATIALSLYHCGFSAYFYLMFGTLNKKRLDLTQGNAMNWQGVGKSQWLVGLPVMGTPFVIVGLFFAFGKYELGYMVLAAVSLINILLYPFWRRALLESLEQHRYTMAEGFRS